MERRRPPGGRARGGEDIQATRQAGTRVAAGAGALACAAALGALPLARGSDPVVDVGFRVVAVALLALLASLVLGWPRLVPVPLLLLGALYGGQLAVDEAVLDASAPLFAAGVAVTVELAYWSLEEREGVKAEPGDAFRRLAFVAALGVVSLAVGATLLAVVDVVRTGGLAVDVVGAAAAAAALALVVLLARRQAQE